MAYSVFISYSHEDADRLFPIIQFVRALRNDLVFQDTIDIKPGTLWQPAIDKALSEAELIIVFWCSHSAKSPYVKREYETAIKRKKNVLPVLLDKSYLPQELFEYQYIDFSRTHFHDGSDAPMKNKLPHEEKTLPVKSWTYPEFNSPGAQIGFKIVEFLKEDFPPPLKSAQ